MARRRWRWHLFETLSKQHVPLAGWRVHDARGFPKETHKRSKTLKEERTDKRKEGKKLGWGALIQISNREGKAWV
jgi:hypothetical protein